MPPREFKVYTVNGFVHSFVYSGFTYSEAWHRAAYADGYVQSRYVGDEEWEPGIYWRKLNGWG